MTRNPNINSIAVFSGSNFGAHEDYIEQAKKLGQKACYANREHRA